MTRTASDIGLPMGTWVSRKGVRRFMPTDPTWTPPDQSFAFDPSLVLDLTLVIEPIRVTPHRHICDCGCLLFGIENCPQCEWLAQINEQKVA